MMTTNDGRFVISTRIYLTAAQRSQLELLLRQQQHDLPELLSELVVSLLAQQPIAEPELDPPPAPADPAALQQQIAQRRAEMRRLQARAVQGGGAAPAWVQQYLAELAQEVQQLEDELRRAAPSE
ncbi:MAG: hypothetical protein HC911_07000 [Chloroflexaceae bacterium]|nr:hypothetical protein [Chloroflexaceae bacterium]